MWSVGIGNHQKINKIALSKLADLVPVSQFPRQDLLRHFEGKRGPDGVKVKSPGKNEPVSFFDPFDPSDTLLLEGVMYHYSSLVESLKSGNSVKSAFDASWLAHTVVDGLTPAHHFPYESEVKKLRDRNHDSTLKDLSMRPGDKISVRGANRVETIRNNWHMWGAKGLLLTHATFEGGVALITLPMRFKNLTITDEQVEKAHSLGVSEYIEQVARKIALQNMYDQFYRRGWTFSLARQVKTQLLPDIITAVAAVWYCALKEAGMAEVR